MGTPRVLLGRELCLFRLIDARKVPAKQRREYVDLAIRRTAPFDDAGWDAAWFGGLAAVWFWSKSRVLQTLGQSSAQGARWLPEPAFIQPSSADACELLDLASLEGSGCEGRVWQGGALLGSRWWPEPPDAEEWSSFMRGCGRAPEPRPALAPASRAEGRIGEALGSGPWLDGAWSVYRPAIAGVTACLISAALAVQVGGWAAGRSAARQVEAQLVQRQQELEQILTARGRSDEAQAGIRAALGLQPAASTSRLLFEVTQALGADGWTLVDWNQSGPDALEIIVKMPASEVERAVAALEATPSLKQVTPATSANRDPSFNMRIAPLDERLPK